MQIRGIKKNCFKIAFKTSFTKRCFSVRSFIIPILLIVHRRHLLSEIRDRLKSFQDMYKKLSYFHFQFPLHISISSLLVARESKFIPNIIEILIRSDRHIDAADIRHDTILRSAHIYLESAHPRVTPRKARYF